MGNSHSIAKKHQLPEYSISIALIIVFSILKYAIRIKIVAAVQK
jgi:hypothetical protein